VDVATITSGAATFMEAALGGAPLAAAPDSERGAPLGRTVFSGQICEFDLAPA